MVATAQGLVDRASQQSNTGIVSVKVVQSPSDRGRVTVRLVTASSDAEARCSALVGVLARDMRAALSGLLDVTCEAAKSLLVAMLTSPGQLHLRGGGQAVLGGKVSEQAMRNLVSRVRAELGKYSTELVLV